MNPNNTDTFDRAQRLANIAVWTVDMQVRRLKGTEPEDEHFVLRKWSDFHFLIVALSRLKRAASLAAKVPEISGSMKDAIRAFNKALPELTKIRNVAEHIDDYVVGNGKDKSVKIPSLEVASIKDEELVWLGYSLNTKMALLASIDLFEEIKKCKIQIKKSRTRR